MMPILTVSFFGFAAASFCVAFAVFAILNPPLTGSASQHAVAFAQIRRRNFGVMREEREPAFCDHLRNPLLFIFERGHRIQIVAHDPGQRADALSVGTRSAKKKRRLAAAGELHALHVCGVAGHANQFHSGRDRAIAFEQRKLAGGFERHIIVREIAGAVAFGGMLGVFEFAALDDVVRRWETWERFYLLPRACFRRSGRSAR